MVPARLVLYMLSFTGFLVSFMMRSDINIAIVAMVKLPPPTPITANTSSISADKPLYCYTSSVKIPINDSSVRSTLTVVINY